MFARETELTRIAPPSLLASGEMHCASARAKSRRRNIQVSWGHTRGPTDRADLDKEDYEDTQEDRNMYEWRPPELHLPPAHHVHRPAIIVHEVRTKFPNAREFPHSDSDAHWRNLDAFTCATVTDRFERLRPVRLLLRPRTVNR